MIDQGLAGLPAGAVPDVVGQLDPASDESTSRKNLLQLIQLRWIAVAGQIAATLFASRYLGIELPMAGMGVVIGTLVLLNAASLALLRSNLHFDERFLFGSLLLDVLALTAELYLSGGAANPFAFLYILQVTLAAVLLPTPYAIIVAVGAGLGFFGLWQFNLPLQLPPGSPYDLPGLRVGGTLVCFVLEAALLLVFITRISRNLRDRDAHLAALRQQAAEESHIVRMGLLASGAAHELGTPLSTLSVILGDWRRSPALAGDPEMLGEIDEMQNAVRVCKSILSGVLMSAGEARGEALEVTTVSAFVAGLADDWRQTRASKALHYQNRLTDNPEIIADSVLKLVIFNVLDNALEASPHWIRLEAEAGNDRLRISILDAGPGFAPEVLPLVGQPYLSTKGRPGGGLGLFLVVNVIRKLGGRVSASNRSEGGARVEIELPLDRLAA